MLRRAASCEYLRTHKWTRCAPKLQYSSMELIAIIYVACAHVCVCMCVYVCVFVLICVNICVHT